MKSLIIKCPLNSLSFGNVSYNLLREAFKKEIDVCLFPIGDRIDLQAYDKIDENFQSWIKDSFEKRLTASKKDIPTLQLWHLNGSENRISSQQHLLTFYELDCPTLTEKNLSDLQSSVTFSSKYAMDRFKSVGCENVNFASLGFDEDFHKTDKKYLEGKVHFGLMGKFEKRKHTAKLIKAWAKKYGNNYDYQLTCCVFNPFFKKEQMDQIIAQTLEGKRYGNINFLPYLQTNSEVNDFLNSIDIDLSGMSGAEGWNLPAFNSSCLGKHSIVLNSTSHKDWANKDNCILVEPTGKETAEDKIFFHAGQPFNQGHIYCFDEEDFCSKMDEAIKACEKVNTEGEKLKEKFTYKKMFENILKTIGDYSE